MTIKIFFCQTIPVSQPLKERLLDFEKIKFSPNQMTRKTKNVHLILIRLHSKFQVSILKTVGFIVILIWKNVLFHSDWIFLEFSEVSSS